MHNRHQLISLAERNIFELQTAIENTKLSVLDHCYIVRLGPTFLTLDVDEKGIVSNPRPERPDRCLCMTLRDVQNVCAILSNEEGDIAEPVHIKDAMVLSLEGQRIFLSQLTSERLGA